MSDFCTIDLLQNVQIKDAYRIIADLARSYHSNVPLISPDAFEIDGKNSEDVVMRNYWTRVYPSNGRLR